MSISPKHYLWLGNLLVLGLVIWSGVSLGLSVFGHRLETRLGSKRPVVTDRAAGPGPRSLAHYEAIARQNIFGGESRESAAPSNDSNKAQAQVSSGDLRLRGTVVDPRTDYALAVIENIKTKKQDIYRAGDRIGSAEVVRVNTDMVTLRQGGRTINLKIFEEKAADLPWDKSKTSPAQVPKGQIAKSLGQNRYVVSRGVLGEHVMDLNRFMSKVRIVPYFKSGQPHGFKVASLRRESPLHKLGLRRGDVIVQVNGVSVRKPEDLVNMYRQIQQLDTVTLDLERRGKPVTLNYFLR